MLSQVERATRSSTAVKHPYFNRRREILMRQEGYQIRQRHRLFGLLDMKSVRITAFSAFSALSAI